MSIPQYFEYKGQKYGCGTRLKVMTRYFGIVETTYLGGTKYEGLSPYSLALGSGPESYIVEIIEPVYYTPPSKQDGKKSSVFTRTGSGSWNSSDDVFHGLLLYIAVMLGGIIFNDRWLIWIVATWIFFSWKNKK